jgi:hypothetical protein
MYCLQGESESGGHQEPWTKLEHAERQLKKPNDVWVNEWMDDTSVCIMFVYKYNDTLLRPRLYVVDTLVCNVTETD